MQALFAQSGAVAADAAKVLRSLDAAEATGDLLLHFGHAQVPLGEVVVEGHGEVIEERRHRPPMPLQAIRQVTRGLCLRRPFRPEGGGGGWARPLCSTMRADRGRANLALVGPLHRSQRRSRMPGWPPEGFPLLPQRPFSCRARDRHSKAVCGCCGCLCQADAPTLRCALRCARPFDTVAPPAARAFGPTGPLPPGPLHIPPESRRVSSWSHLPPAELCSPYPLHHPYSAWVVTASQPLLPARTWVRSLLHTTRYTIRSRRNSGAAAGLPAPRRRQRKAARRHVHVGEESPLHTTTAPKGK